jgi:hypothetical protein
VKQTIPKTTLHKLIEFALDHPGADTEMFEAGYPLLRSLRHANDTSLVMISTAAPPAYSAAGGES